MSEAAAGHAAHEQAHGHGESFIDKYIFSTDHKMIAKQFLWYGLIMMIFGGLFAMMVRWQLAWPETAVPGFGWVPEPYMYGGIIPPAFYNTLFTMHATLMIFFVIMPILVGCFGNYLIPLMIGAEDMAFPKLNLLSFWVAVIAAVVMIAGFFVPGGHAAGGWTAYAPLSAKEEFTGVGMGMNLWIISLIILGFSSMAGSINYITTTINMRASGMTFFRMPLVLWSLFVVAVLLLLALPVLVAGLAMLLFDRMLGSSFFLAEGGGDPLLWQHIFWFFGHPEVYVLILPAMGIASDVLSTFSRKPVFGYRSMAYALIAIGFLGFVVWGHHMFQSGMNPALGTGFMISTMVIAVPSAIKTFNWLGTLWGGQIRFTVPMMNALAFVSMFVIGGLSGIYMASTPVDIYIHDTYFIVAHIHYVVFGGSFFGLFAGIYYWYPKMFGKEMSKKLGYWHFFPTFVFFNCTFFPMHILGVGGMMRRIYNPAEYDFLQPLLPMNVFVTVSAILLGFSQIPFVINFIGSMVKGKKAAENPWQANTVEWSAPTPVPHGNFPVAPVVYRGPYEYSSPEVTEDWLPQTKKLETQAASAH